MPNVETNMVLESKLSAVIQRCHCGPDGTAVHPGAECPNPEIIDVGVLSITRYEPQYSRYNEIRRVANITGRVISGLLARRLANKE